MASAIAGAKEGKTILLTNDITLDEAWTPIGTKEAPFSGTFDGNGHTISGLEIDADEAAFFGYVASDATIKNVIFEDVDVNGKDAAVVAYYADAATIENVQVSGSVNATSYGAGIVLEGSGTIIKDCVNDATINAGYSASGIGGWILGNATVDGCENNGDVTGANRAGGICANFAGTMTDCVNNGDVVCTGGMPAGGIIGVLSGVTTIENCTNNGDVTNTGTNQWNSSAAGILAQTPSAKVTIKSCVNSGDITAEKSWAAGIGVSLYGGITAEGCSNTGVIAGTKTADTVDTKGMFGGTNTVTG